MDDLIERICRRYGLSLCENLGLGCNSDMISVVADATGSKFVVKAARNQGSVAEVRMNNIGYRKLAECGLGFFIPKIIAYESGGDYAFMIIEYLGPNFLEQLRGAERPLDLCLSLMRSLEKVYSVSLQENTKGGDAIRSFIGETERVYEEWVYPNLDRNRRISSLLQQLHLSIDTSSISCCCFSNWDFTPEDVYLTDTGVKYSDPHDNIFGIPIIDMACFGGLVKLYGLRQGDEAYEAFRIFATGKVAEILHIPARQAEKIFYLGRLFQCFMSIRFRHEKRPGQARIIFHEAKEVIEKII